MLAKQTCSLALLRGYRVLGKWEFLETFAVTARRSLLICLDFLLWSDSKCHVPADHRSTKCNQCPLMKR